MVEEAAHRALDPLVLAPRRRPQVDVVEHELAQPQHRPAQLLALDDVPGRRRALDDVVHQRVDPPRAGRAEQLDLVLGQV